MCNKTSCAVWNVSLTNQILEMNPPTVLSPVKAAQTGHKDAQPAAKCFCLTGERADPLGSDNAGRVYE